MRQQTGWPYLLLTILLGSCTLTGPGFLRKKSPHEKYGQQLIEAGLQEKAMGRAWFEQAEQSLIKPLTVSIPYKERGYFAPERADASALRFQVKQGEKLNFALDKTPADNFTIFMDLWEVRGNDKTPKLLAYADTTDSLLSFEADKAGFYLLRLQPELLSGGEYTLTITSGPSLAFPVQGKGRNSIQSLYGASRDAGARRHEGIDIFASRGTPALAAAMGKVTRVGLNNLGGKVVFFRPENKNYVLYYAHLDSQLVKGGEILNTGDSVGLIGNTGNAITTAPHLHFGIYTPDGVADPLPFIDPLLKEPENISSSLSENIGKSLRINTGNQLLYQSIGNDIAEKTSLGTGTLFRIDAASAGWYKVTLPDGSSGFVKSRFAGTSEMPLRKIMTSGETPVYDRPDTLAARKAILSKGEPLSLLGNFKQFYFVEAGDISGWISSF